MLTVVSATKRGVKSKPKGEVIKQLAYLFLKYNIRDKISD